MPIRLTARRAILAKIESVYGTDPTPTGAADAMYVSNLSLTPMENVLAERNPLRPFFGPDTPAVGGTPVKVEFEISLAGAGAIAAIPGYGPLYRAAGMSQTVNAAVDCTYALISSAFESVTLYCNLDGVNHRVTGFRVASINEEFNHNEIPKAKISGIGLYNAPSDTALPALTFGTTWQKPLVVNKVNTTPVSLHATAVVMSKFSLQIANEVSWRDYVNGTEEVRLTGRKVTGSITVQADNVAFKDWFGIAKAGTTGAFTLTHGTATGNRVKRDSATVQLINPSYEEEDGIQMVKMDLAFFPTSAGNDDVVLRTL